MPQMTGEQKALLEQFLKFVISRNSPSSIPLEENAAGCTALP